MAGEKHGIKETKEVLDLGFAVGKVVKDGLADGKIGLEDLGLLMGLVPHLGPAFGDIGKVPDELKDLDSDETKELLEYASNKLEGVFSDQELIAKINAGLKVGLAVAELIKVL